MERIAVYCGSSYGTGRDYVRSAADVGRLIAENGLALVYGGSEIGLMGTVADAYLSAGGTELVGVIPKQFSRMSHPCLSQLHVTNTMHERKNLMFEISDGFLVLPGGLGTLDEMVEVIEWARLGMHSKPVGLLNTADYFGHFLRFFDRIAAEGFCVEADRARVLVDTDPARLLVSLHEYGAPVVNRWWATVEAGARIPVRLPPFDPHDESTLTDPYPVYARYRRHDPVHWGAPYNPGAQGCWYLFHHHDVVTMLRDRRFRRQWPARADPQRRRNVPAEQAAFWDVFDRLLLSTDPPDHRRLRTLVSHAFTPHQAERYRPLARAVASELAAALPAEFDLVEDYAAQLSFTVVGTILGIPVADNRTVREWITRFGGGFDLRRGEHAMTEASEAAGNLIDYFGTLVARRRRDPADDVLTALINAREDEHRLSEDELLAMCVQLLFAGHETTTAQISTTMHSLLCHPDQLALVQQDVALVPAAISESLRLNGSVQTAAARKPVEDVMIGGRLITTGQPVIAFIGAANRDPIVFPHPDRFDVRRDNSAAVAFGAGIHYCLGAHLAKVEAEVGVATLLSTRPKLRADITVSAPARRRNVVLRGIEQLSVSG